MRLRRIRFAEFLFDVVLLGLELGLGLGLEEKVVRLSVTQSQKTKKLEFAKKKKMEFAKKNGICTGFWIFGGRRPAAKGRSQSIEITLTT